MLYFILFLISLNIVFGQTRLLVPRAEQMQIEKASQSKILSGMLLQHLNEKSYKLRQGEKTPANEFITCALYFESFPNSFDLKSLEDAGVRLYATTWVPPFGKYPLGFMLAAVPVAGFQNALALDCIKKMDSGEYESYPMNNQAAKKIKADSVWAKGYTGTGIKIAVLDSGLDTQPTNSDLPATLEKKDYSNYPTSIDTTVENTVTGHGTHVTGSVLGRGALSPSNTGNGGGSYKGMAYNADLVFLKIGSDASGSASNAAEIAAMQAAVDTFNAQILTMSYGGWATHHDGTSSTEQTADWVVSRGRLFFIAAGNDAASGRHYSGTVNANDSTGFIRIDVTSAGTNNTALYMNLVYSDGASHRDLSVKYYNSSQVELSNVVNEAATESSAGTESRYCYYNSYLPSGSGTYYMRVFNNTAGSQFFHVYETWNNGKVKFNAPDPYYTISNPASADSVCAVGAYVSRATWTDYSGSSWGYGYTLNDYAPFSNRGPRVDGWAKPDISAPGSVVISIRDRDVYVNLGSSVVDDDGTIGSGGTDYFVMQGTSMATPVAAGAAALILQRYPNLTPAQVIAAIKAHADVDSYTGSVPNSSWGAGKLNINGAIEDNTLPVELVSFTAVVHGNVVQLKWETATERQNYGYYIQRRNAVTADWQTIGFSPGAGNSNTPRRYSFADNAPFLREVYYRLKQVDNDGSVNYSSEVKITAAPQQYALMQNYPNPFNPVTVVMYHLPAAGHVTIKVYDVIGKVVSTPVDDDRDAGRYSFTFSADNLSNGMYLYEMTCGSFRSVKKMCVLK